MLALLALPAAPAGAAGPAGGRSRPTVTQYSSPAAVGVAARTPAAAAVPGGVRGLLSAPGGPYLHDASGRVVFLHGVNAVYKKAPFELFVAPGRPWNFGPADAAWLARQGFTVVRLGISWEALEPGHGPVNDPATCTPGRPRDPHLFRTARAAAYLDRLVATVNLLGRDHLYSLIDMHQDVYSRSFRGEGAPNWAVCTDGQPIVPDTGRWSRNYANHGLDVAVDHFWNNDVVGDLQGQYDRVWQAVARRLAPNPWVVGYDPYNEPFELETMTADAHRFAVELSCFYAGRAFRPVLADRDDRGRCPPDDPAQGVVPTIERADPHHLVFIEPDLFSKGPRATRLGPLPFGRLVYNVHLYCPQRSPVTGDPTDLAACLAHDGRALAARAFQRPRLAGPHQRAGPPWFVSEFGATDSVPLVRGLVGLLGRAQVGWAYWSYKYFGDPTGSRDEALVTDTGRVRPTAGALAVTYAQAVAGQPGIPAYDPVSGAFTQSWRPAGDHGAPTVVFVGTTTARRGYCTAVTGGRVLSPPGRTHLLVAADRRARRVVLRITPGWCPATRG